MAKKPPGLDRFAEALGIVAGVPKEQIESKVAANKGRGGKGAEKRLKKQRKKK